MTAEDTYLAGSPGGQYFGFYADSTFDFVGPALVDFANTYHVGSRELVGLRAGVTRERWEVFAEARTSPTRASI